MKKLYSPENDAELALIKSIFDGESIQYFLHNDHFGSLKVGPKIDMFNAKTIMVLENHYDRAFEIIQDFISSQKPGLGKHKTCLSLKDKIRMIIETLLFLWFMPGKRWRKKSD